MSVYLLCEAVNYAVDLRASLQRVRLLQGPMIPPHFIIFSPEAANCADLFECLESQTFVPGVTVLNLFLQLLFDTEHAAVQAPNVT